MQSGRAMAAARIGIKRDCTTRERRESVVPAPEIDRRCRQEISSRSAFTRAATYST